MAEPSRDRQKLEAIHAMLPRLREYLPTALFAELAAQLYVLPLPSRPPQVRWEGGTSTDGD